MGETEGQIVTHDADAKTAKPAQPDKPAGKRRRGGRATQAAAASPESRPAKAPERSGRAAVPSEAKDQADAAPEPAKDPATAPPAGPEDVATAPAPEPAVSDPWATTWTVSIARPMRYPGAPNLLRTVSIPDHLAAGAVFHLDNAERLAGQRKRQWR